MNADRPLWPQQPRQKCEGQLRSSAEGNLCTTVKGNVQNRRGKSALLHNRVALLYECDPRVFSSPGLPPLFAMAVQS